MTRSDDHFIQVYKTRAAAYHALIAAEDAEHHLLPALQAITPLAGKRILDLGSGTGRIPILLRGLGCEIVALDLHHAMLLEQKTQAIKIQPLRGGSNANETRRGNPQRLLQTDIRQLPIQSAWADIVTAGWAIGHFTGWFPETWKQEAEKAINEMKRAAKPGGTLIIMETMGTGVQQPAPPNAALAAYYEWLKNEQGLTRQVISTDYEFDSVNQAAELCGEFFGTEMAERVRANGWRRVPEWTGIWSKSIS